MSDYVVTVIFFIVEGFFVARPFYSFTFHIFGSAKIDNLLLHFVKILLIHAKTLHYD
jgi:hypothetical protein